MNSGVYIIKNLINGNFYIGSSCDIKKRWNSHKSGLRNNKHVNKHLQNAWNKYGEENFIFEIIEECLPEFCIKREQYYLDSLLEAQKYIKKEKSLFRIKGYNINPTANSQFGKVVSEETKEKMRKNNLGKKHPESVKLKISQSLKGKIYKKRKQN